MANPAKISRVAVLSAGGGWHYRDLVRAAADDYEIFNMEFSAICAEIDSSGKEKFNLESDCVIVRTMPPGSLQQIVFRMDLLARLERSGTHIVNPPKSIEAAVDKYLSLALLSSAGLPTPTTCVAQTVADAIEQFEQLDGDSVVKPLFGSMGHGIERLQNISDALSYFESTVAAGNVVFQQEFVDHGGFDIRMLVIGDDVFGMKRVNNKHWITNVSQGGIGEPYSLSEVEKDMAIGATRSVGALIAGVDLMYDSNNGEPSIIEVNAVPGWRATSEVLGLDIARLILECVVEQAV